MLLPPAVLESWTLSWEKTLSRISCPIRPNHLLNWLWTSAQLCRFIGCLCICELLHQLCCWTPSVYVCVCWWVCVCVCSPSPCMSLYKSVCGPFLCKILNTHTHSPPHPPCYLRQDSGGGLGPAEEEPGRRSWGSPKVLFKGNSSHFSPPLISCHLLDARTEFSGISVRR